MSYFDRLAETVKLLPPIDPLVNALRTARARDQTVFVVGNGGSQANGQHLVLHLRDCGIAAHDVLADNAWLTARANDYGYETAPAAYLKVNASAMGYGDIVFAISGSGKSRNVLSALVHAQGRDLTTIGLLGMGGGDALTLCDVAYVVPSDDYGLIEDAHSAVIHALYEALR